MKRTVTGFFSACFAVMLGIGCCTVPANAKVIEPEIVKTESWTTSYYIDDDMDTLYPYIQCEADIYNDGTIKLYMWNTHEWGGSSPIKQNVTFCQYTRDLNTISDGDFNEFSGLFSDEGFCNMNNYVDVLDPDYEADNSVVRQIDRNLHPTTYVLEMNSSLNGVLGSNRSGDAQYVYLHILMQSKPGLDFSSSSPYQLSYARPSVAIALAEMKVYNHAEEGNLLATYHPISKVTTEHTFRLFGHDITITPELLSGNIVAEPELTEQEQKIKQLEAENAALKAQLAAFDSDADGLLTTADAQMILIYYTEYLAGAVSGTTGDYAAYIKQFKGQ